MHVVAKTYLDTKYFNYHYNHFLINFQQLLQICNFW